MEEAVSHQLIEHVDNNNLGEPLQSAYKSLHNTETTLLKVQDDILNAIDQHQRVALLLLDLSAAFDTVDHESLLHRLCVHFGIRGKAQNSNNRQQQRLYFNSSEKGLCSLQLAELF